MTLVSAKDLAAAPNIREMFAEQTRRVNRSRPKNAPKPIVRYKHPDLGDDPEPDPHAAFHLDAVRTIGEALRREYPGHGTMVYLEAAGGVCTIEIPPLVIKPGCGAVNLVKTPRHQWEAVAIRVMGELLERLRLGRERFDQGDMVAAIKRRSLRDVRRGIIPE